MAAVIVAVHASLLLVARVSIAGAVNELDGPADVRARMTADERVPALHEFEPGRNPVGAGQSLLNPLKPESHSDAAWGIWFSIHGVAFTFDQAVARSYRTELANNATLETDDPTAIGNSNAVLTEYNVRRVRAGFQEHMKSAAASGFSQPQLLQVNEWDARDFKPPEWAQNLRDLVRNEATPVEEVPTTSRPATDDIQSWVIEGMKAFTYIQKQVQRLDPVFLAILGVLSVPFALTAIALSMRRRRGRSRVARKMHNVDSPPITAGRIRRRRKRIRMRHLGTVVRN